jgi:hypothetical protein
MLLQARGNQKKGAAVTPVKELIGTYMYMGRER